MTWDDACTVDAGKGNLLLGTLLLDWAFVDLNKTMLMIDYKSTNCCSLQDADKLLHFYTYIQSPFNYNCSAELREADKAPYTPGVMCLCCHEQSCLRQCTHGSDTGHKSKPECWYIVDQ
jgi:hypothetical protein